MNDTIDYAKLGLAVAQAALTVEDDTADQIAATIPDDLKSHPNGLYAIPARGSVPGPQRLATARQIAARAQEHGASAAARSAEQAETAQRQANLRADFELKNKLGLPMYEPFPKEFSRAEMQKFADCGEFADFARELAKRKAEARAVGTSSRKFL